MAVALLMGKGKLPEAAASVVRSHFHVVEYGEPASALINCMGTKYVTPEMLDFYGGYCFNLHNAKLPGYKGRNALSHGILNGEKEHTVTIHWMTEELDAGDIAFEESLPIRDDDTAYTLYLRCIPVAERLMRNLCAAIVHDDIPRKPQVGNWHFYAKDSLEPLKHLRTNAQPEAIALIARALSFPGFEPPYFVIDGRRYYITPGGSE